MCPVPDQPAFVFDKSISARFNEFHSDNPKVYSLFVRFARQLKAAGRRGSAKLIFERLRWEFAISTASSDDFKLNNNFTSHYARLAMDLEPDLVGFFEIRRLRSL